MRPVTYRHPDESSSIHLRRKEVVIVDRDIAGSKRLAEALEGRGFGARLCADPVWAAEVCKGKPTDLVVVSSSAGVEGIRDLMRYRKSAVRFLPLMALLDSADHGSGEEWGAMGFDGMLRPPFTPAAFVDAVGTLIGVPWCRRDEDP